jgi:hypothetical protein
VVDLNLFQRVGDFFEQRKQFRAAALTALRKREGLPSPVDENNNPLETRFDDQGQVQYYDQSGKQVERVLFSGAGRDGKPGAFAVGKRKGEALREAEQRWNSPAEFEILEVAEDGRQLQDEIADLDRDSSNYEMGERVSHGTASEQAPGLVLDGTSDEEVDQKLQQYLKKEKQ